MDCSDAARDVDVLVESIPYAETRVCVKPFPGTDSSIGGLMVNRWSTSVSGAETFFRKLRHILETAHLTQFLVHWLLIVAKIEEWPSAMNGGIALLLVFLVGWALSQWWAHVVQRRRSPIKDSAVERYAHYRRVERRRHFPDGGEQNETITEIDKQW